MSTAEKAFESVNQTIWKVTTNTGKIYRAFTYPNSKPIRLESWIKGKRISPTIALRLYAEVRAAIEGQP